MASEKIEKIKTTSKTIKKEVRKQTIGYILAGIGVVVGLAWNEAIKGLIELVFPLAESGVVIKFLYAIIMTLVIVIASMYLVKLTKDDPDEVA